MSRARPAPRWSGLLRPRWLAWHAAVVGAVAGMLWLGDWQLRRALAGNGLSWAYTVEWPVFAVLAVAFWVRSLREELRPPDAAGSPAAQSAPAGAPSGPSPSAREADEAAAAAYAARLRAEVRRHGRWHGLR